MRKLKSGFGEDEAQKLSEQPRDSRSIAHIKAVSRGRNNESAAVAKFEWELTKRFRGTAKVAAYPVGILIHTDAYWIAASPDKLYVEIDSHVAFFLLEVKTVDPEMTVENFPRWLI